MLNIENLTALILAPHPDDEVFGCGGIIHRLKKAGSRVYVLYLTVGEARDFSASGFSAAADRLNDLEKVAHFYGLDGYSVAFPGNDYHLRLDAMAQHDLISAIERDNDLSLENIRPDVVFTTAGTDYNQDHRAVFNATMTALRPASAEFKSFQPFVLTYELPYQQWNVGEGLSESNFYVRLDESDMDAKIAALELYQSQLKSPDSPLSIRGVQALASYRGLQCGTRVAEAFQVMRLVA